MKNLPLIAAVVAFMLAAIGLLAAFQQPVLALFALVPLFAGVGILRKRVWSAYGFAAFELAQIGVALFTASRTDAVLKPPQLGLAAGLNVFFALLFFLAGRKLAASGAANGLILPWIAVCCLFAVPLFFFRAFVVPSGGMEDTLLIGDRIMTRVFPRVKPARGDIVVFRYPLDKRQIFIKRIIGLPGDHIRIASKTVYRNGTALAESYAIHNFKSVDVPVAKSETVVPPGKYFVLGDNRDNSLDSRYWGFVDAADIIGKPVLIYDSSEPAMPGNLRRTIRWRRLFKLL